MYLGKIMVFLGFCIGKAGEYLLCNSDFRLMIFLLMVGLYSITSINADEESVLKEIENTNEGQTEQAQDDDGEDEKIVVSATRIYRNKSDGSTVTVDLSEDSDIVESVSRSIQPANWSGASFDIVTEAEMIEREDRTVKEALEYIPGVNFTTTGQPGGSTTVSIRGANAEHTAVLLDGVRLNNQLGSGGSGIFDMANLSSQGLSRVEILRGPQSALYGSQAMGGAVDMKMKKGVGKATFKISQDIGGGQHMLYRTRASSQGGNDKVNYFVAGEWTETKGLGSSASPGAINEADGYDHPLLMSRFGVTPTDYLEISVIANYSHLNTGIDGGAAVDTADANSFDQEVFIRPKIWLSTFCNTWEHELGFAYINSQQKTTDPTTVTDSHYDSNAFQIDYKTILKALEWNTLVAGCEYRIDTGEVYGTSWGGDLEDIDKNGMNELNIYAQDQVRLFDDWWISNVGGRITSTSTTDFYATWHADSVVNIKSTGTRFKVSAGSGFKSPTLYQLYAPALAPWFPGGTPTPVGNKALLPEKSFGWDIGMEQDLLAFWKRNIWKAEATYFNNYYMNLINWNATDGFANIAHATTEGVELSTTISACNMFDFTAGYTYTKTENITYTDPNYNHELPRRPANRFFMNANAKLFDNKLNLNAGIIYSGDNWNDTANITDIDGAWNFNLAGSYQLHKHVRLYGRLNNVFSSNCTSVAGYDSPKFNGFGGIEVSF